MHIPVCGACCGRLVVVWGGRGGERERARARADSVPHPYHIFRGGGAFQTSERGKAFIPPQKNFLGVLQWAEAAQMFEVTQMQLID